MREPIFARWFACCRSVRWQQDGDKRPLTVFELFEQENSAYRVVQRFHQLGLRFPRRAYGGAWDGKLIWGRLIHSRVIGVLANPCYAGTYVFGRYQIV